MKCPRCKSSLRKVNVKVQDSKKEIISYQCGKCGYFEFDPDSTSKVLAELKKRAGGVSNEDAY
jgi:transposase-like protein